MALLEALARIAESAGAVVRDIYQRGFLVEYKAPGDPVTEADRAANQLICDELARVLPGVPIVAEESEPDSYGGFRAAERILFVDPLDGTREFVDKRPEFAVMIGLCDGHRAVAGVIHAPMGGVTFLGAADVGAWRRGPGDGRVPIRVSTTSSLSDARVLVSRSHRSAALDRAVQQLGVRETIPLGSAGLKGAEVAAGAAELYVAPRWGGKRWDACASDALVTAAGGRFSDVDGERIDYRGASLENDRGVVATNAALHDAVIQRLAEMQKAE